MKRVSFHFERFKKNLEQVKNRVSVSYFAATTGSIVYQCTTSAPQVPINISHLADGMYLVILTTEDGRSATQK